MQADTIILYTLEVSICHITSVNSFNTTHALATQIMEHRMCVVWYMVTESITWNGSVSAQIKECSMFSYMGKITAVIASTIIIKSAVKNCWSMPPP